MHKSIGWWSLYAPKKTAKSPLEVAEKQPTNLRSVATQLDYLKMYAALLPQDSKQINLTLAPKI